MPRSSLWGVLLAAALLLSGCYRNNLPISELFGPLPDVPTARLFVDADGRIYPNNWKAALPPATLRHAHAIDRLPLTPRQKAGYDAEARRQLDGIAAQMRGKHRIFILVHGFNSSEYEAAPSYDAIVARIGATREDFVILFYWDGTVQAGPGGQLTGWFSAAGNSQMAGMLGLRRVLDLAHDQDVFLISHSRGASVILSALATPSFTPKFRTRAEKLLGDFTRTPALAENGNRIRAIMLAPAIGAPDFRAADCNGEKHCPRLRIFSGQLKSIRYTINPNDTVLKKGFAGFASRFNPTDLGYDPRVGERLKATYPCLTGVTVRETHGHHFIDYVRDTEFATMLQASQGDTLACAAWPGR
jgi:hypothetical protein